MKLTKKDKIMLLVLGVIMFVAVFFVYMIMPAKEEGKTLDTEIATKKADADKVMANLAAIDTSTLQGKIDNLYEYYYSEKAKDTSKGALHEVLDPIDIEKKMYGIFHDPEHTVVGYETRPWRSMIVTQNVSESATGNAVATVEMVVATIDIKFQIATREQLENLITYFEKDPYFKVLSISATEKHPSPDGEMPDYQFDASMKVEFYMGNKYTTDKIPKALDDVQVSIKEGTVINFTGVANAKYYEIYDVIIAENGDKTYNSAMVDRIAVTEENGEYTVQVPDTVFADGKAHNIAIRAIGDQKAGYFKTIMDKDTPYVTISKAN